MIPRRALSVLVGSLAILVVAFAVVTAFHLLVQALGDTAAARTLLWASVACLLLLCTNLLLLVIALGLRAIRDDESPSGE